MKIFIGLLWLFFAAHIAYGRIRSGRRQVNWDVAAVPCALLALDNLLWSAA